MEKRQPLFEFAGARGAIAVGLVEFMRVEGVGVPADGDNAVLGEAAPNDGGGLLAGEASVVGRMLIAVGGPKKDVLVARSEQDFIAGKGNTCAATTKVAGRFAEQKQIGLVGDRKVQVAAEVGAADVLSWIAVGRVLVGAVGGDRLGGELGDKVIYWVVHGFLKIWR